MFKRSFSGVLAGLCALTAAPAVPAATANAEGDGYAIKATVDLGGEKKSISPYIYGVNAFDAGNVKNVSVNNVRQGGNRYTGYNWETNWSNAGADWHHSSDTNIGDIGEGAGAAARKLSELCQKYNVPYKMLTLQMAGYVSADKAGAVSEAETAPSKRWNKVEFRKDGELSLTPDLDDGVVYMDEYVNYIVKTLGDSKTSKGVQGYSLDNEPALWNDTHPIMHPEEITNTELVSKSIELAKVVKEIDPDAEVFGPAFWGILPCAQAGSDQKFTDPEWTAVKDKYNSYLGYYLDQMKQAEAENGKRLLDVVDVHYYAQDCATDDARLQAARSLYDESYVENSWLQPTWGDFFPFLPWLKKTVDEYYPGTKIAISEYNVADIGNEKNVGKTSVAAVAEAEALGAFASNDVYFATYWGTLTDAPYAASAINLYTNYDGEGSSFGDTLVQSSTEDLSKSAIFASINGEDDSKVAMVLTNKSKTETEKAEVTISGGKSEYKSAVVYAITPDHSDIRIIDVKNDLSGNKLTVDIPALSAVQVVLSDKATDKTVYVAPNIEVKEEKFSFADLDKNANGNYVIPISDAKALKKAVISYSASCSTGADWYGGGGGLCFNKVVLADGTTSWGYKAYGYAVGSNESEVLFDGSYNIPGPNDTSLEVEGTIGDSVIEFQDWWKSSSNSDSGADVSVTYNSITLVYEYDHTGEEPSDPSEPATGDQPYQVKVWGDADLDGQVMMNDVVLVMQSLSNPDRFGENGTEATRITANGKLSADVYENGKSGVTAKDAAEIQRFLLHLRDSLEPQA